MAAKGMIIVADFTEQKKKNWFHYSKEIEDMKDHLYEKQKAGLLMETVIEVGEPWGMSRAVPFHQSLLSVLLSVYALIEISYTLDYF